MIRFVSETVAPYIDQLHCVLMGNMFTNGDLHLTLAAYSVRFDVRSERCILTDN